MHAPKIKEGLYGTCVFWSELVIVRKLNKYIYTVHMWKGVIVIIW